MRKIRQKQLPLKTPELVELRWPLVDRKGFWGVMAKMGIPGLGNFWAVGLVSLCKILLAADSEAQKF